LFGRLISPLERYEQRQSISRGAQRDESRLFLDCVSSSGDSTMPSHQAQLRRLAWQKLWMSRLSVTRSFAR
jgi:hypothetical protein